MKSIYRHNRLWIFLDQNSVGCERKLETKWFKRQVSMLLLSYLIQHCDEKVEKNKLAFKWKWNKLCMCFSNWFTSKCLKFSIHIKIAVLKMKPKLKLKLYGRKHYGLKTMRWKLFFVVVIWCHSGGNSRGSDDIDGVVGNVVWLWKNCGRIKRTWTNE